MIALRGFALLLIFQAVGEALAHLVTLPLPGPVLGLLLVLPALRFAVLRTPIAAAAELLLAHLSLLFVPVGVGVITHLTLVSERGMALLTVIVLSTWVGMIATSLVLRALAPRAAEERRDG